MTTIEYQATLRRIKRDAEEKEAQLAAMIVTGWCWVSIFAVVLICLEVLK